MKRNIVFLIAFILIGIFCKSQTAAVSVTGNFIGQSVLDRLVMTIAVKQNHKYILKIYDQDRKVQKKIRGKWTLDGDKLVLKEKSGTITALEKYKDMWYIADKNGYSYFAKFYQNQDPDEFWMQLNQPGC